MKIRDEKITQVGSNLDEIVTKNIARIDNLISEGAQDATAVKNDDGSIVVTPKQSWRRYNFRYKLPNSGTKRIYYWSVNFTKEEVNTVVSGSPYLCDDNKKNLGMPITKAKSNSRNEISYNHCEIFEYKEETQYEATQMTIEIMTATDVPYTITKESMVLIDVTELTAIIDDYSEFY